ncbi:MAG TPA: hypothetical protein VMW12_05565 [Candidatus Dormibacteraeota bacterium]|nr:hypothetical protein [Candidatus Dormibacteraeota bacterium]
MRVLQHVPKAAEALDAVQVVLGPRESCVAIVLRHLEPQILSARSRGMSDSKIADILAGSGIAYSREYLRVVLARLYPKSAVNPGGTSQRKTRRAQVDAPRKTGVKGRGSPTTVPPVKASQIPTPSHAGFRGDAE